ncbi:zinc finger protein 638 isoform X2 [Salmo salar]|uniref:Zinc finger protein 638 isoform X2 n=1 Tax=Salmo salar TaxID=8030 RepID=A0A1S3SLQ2_SALSA|nr:zinc finger protein 638-like isoform X2 [Salmo salar]|eukprot:XP_014065282.1 PREDICTED: zinc finger protein 638-like isoform X2 [Salmo salar]
MQKNNKKNRVQNMGQQQRPLACTALTKPGNNFALLTESRSQLYPLSAWADRAASAFGTIGRGTPFLFGPSAAIRLAQIEAQLALHQLSIIAAASNHGNQQLALLNLLQQAAANNIAQPLAPVMYQPQQQGAPFNRPRNMPYHQQQPGHSTDGNNMAQMNSYQAGQFPPQTRLPEELESAISVRVQGGRDEDHRLLNQNTQISRQHCVDPRLHGDGQGGSSETAYSNSNNLVSLSCDDQQNQMQDVDWSNYQTPSKLFGLNQQQHLQQSSHSHANPNSGHSGGGMQSWNAPVSELGRPQGGNMQGLYVPESAGSILAGFGLSNDDLEVLSHYPDDQLTPDTLPFILRDIQIHKTNRNTGPPAFSQTHPAIPNLPPPPRPSPPQRHPVHSCTTNIPSFLSVTQTAGKVIDYGHASRAAEEGRDSYKRELPPKERATKPESKPTGSSLKRKAESPRRHDDDSDSKKDKDYRRRAPIPDAHKHKRTPVREPPSRSRSEREGSRSRPQFKARSESSKSTRPSGAKRSSSATKRLPTPTMIGDFSADPPKVYPHTCSLCDMQCERAKDWIDHVNTVNHTASCRDLRNKYPDWNPNIPRRDPSQGQDACATWHSLERSPSRSVSRSLSWSPTPPPGRRISPPTSHGHAPHTSGRHSPSQSHRGSASSAHRPEKRTSESSGISTGSSSREGLKRSRNDPAKCATDHGNRAGVSGKHESGKRESYLSSTSKFPASMSEKPHRPPSSASSKPGAKPAAGKETALGQDSEVQSSNAPQKKPTPTLQKKNPPGSYLLYLTGLPVDAKYQEVVSLVQSFGKVTNVLIIRNEEGEENQGQPQYSKATVCMQKEQDAKALAECLTLNIREHPISVSDQNGEEEITSSIPVIIKGELIGAPKTPAAPNEANLTVKGPEASVGQKNSNERGMVKITGLPESGCSEIDIAKLAQPFGKPVKILLITKPSEALVTMQDVESAQEMVKVYNDMPVCINDSVLNMSLLPNLLVDFNRPVALFHSLMGPRNPVSKAEVGGDDDWNRLLVVSNIPATPSGPTEIQKLVQRFGTVQQTLALKDKIIFEMGTADMAKSVFNRFQKFPCIVQNNKLAFSWKPDPKIDLPKVDISAAGSTASTGDNDSQTAETTMPPGGQEDSLSQSGLKVESGTGVDTKVEGQEVQPGNQGMKVEGEVQATKESPALGGKDQEKEPNASSVQPAGVNQREATKPNIDQPRGQGGEEVTEKVADISTTESEETEEPVSSAATSAPQAAKPETEKMSVSSSTTATSAPAPKVMAAIIEALRQESRNRSSTKVSTEQAAAENPPGKQPKDKETPDVQAAPALPRVTPEILKVLLEECRVRSSSRAGAEQARKEQDQAPPAGQKPSTGNRRDHSGDREPGREQVTKRKTREEEREERESARKEREKRLKAQEEEREKGRREKRWSHRERSSGSPGSRSSMRYDGSRRSGKSGARSESRRGNGEEKQQEEEELGENHIPFDMADFVTVDEVGEVAAVPRPLPETTTEVTEVMEVTVNDPVTTALEAEQQAPDDTTPMEVEGEPRTAKVQEEALDKREQKEGLSPATTEEGSVKTAEGTGEVTEEKVPDCQDYIIKEPVVTVPKTTCDEVTEESKVKGHDEATPTDAPAGEEEKEAGRVEDLNIGTFLTVDEVGQVEEDGGKRSAETVESKRRRTSQEEREEETARRKMKMEPLFYKDYIIPPFNPDCPVGMEFLVPKSGFFCKVCSKFYSGTDEAEKNHCKTLKHHQNLEKSLEKWRVKKD